MSNAPDRSPPCRCRTNPAPSPPGQVVDLAKGFSAEIRLRHGARIANGKSLISLLNLGAVQGAALRVSAEGPDAQAALAAIAAAFEAGLEDDEDTGAAAPETATPGRTGAGASMASYEGRTLVGISSSPGYALAPVFRFARDEVVFDTDAADAAVETARLETALQTAWHELEDLHDGIWKKSGPAHAAIFRAHQAFLHDPELVCAAKALIGQGRSAGFAGHQVFTDRADRLEAMPDAVLSGRAIDLRDAGQRVCSIWAGGGRARRICSARPASFWPMT